MGKHMRIKADEQAISRKNPARGEDSASRPGRMQVAAGSRRGSKAAKAARPANKAMEITGRGGGGKGGGGGSARTPVEQPDSLQSRSTAKIIELLCEGEIVGLVNGAQSIFFGDTPLKAEDGTDNFKGVQWQHVTGTPDQEPLEGFPMVEQEVAVGVEVLQSAPVIRTVTGPDLDAVRINIRIPQLSQVTATGDLVGSAVSFKIGVKPFGGAAFLDTAVTREWKSFGGQTAADVSGIEVTVQDVTPSGSPSVSYAVGVEYRAVGDPDWLPLGAESGTFAVSQQVRQVEQIMYGVGGEMTQIFETFFYPSVTISRTYTKTGLAPGIYEVRATAGAISLSRASTPVPITISGKTTSGYEQVYRLDLPKGGSPWDLQVERLTADSTSTKTQNSLIWQSYTEIVDEKLSYPDSALVGLAVDSKQFGNSIPNRAYDIKGLIIDVPSNYDPELRTYNGVWDGTFKRAWSDNPAWCLRDLLINSRYGLGLDDADVDKWSLLQISKYCDELVPDGFGGTEPRFKLNVILQTREEAYAVINSLVSTFRGIVYWASGAVTVGQDSPTDPDRLVTPANVVDGEFSYSGTALKARHSAALIQWHDPNEGHRPTVEMTEDAGAIQKFGYRPSEVVAFGTTNRGQAHRLGKWLLDTEQSATETVTYRAGFDHADLAPGKIIAVADPDHAGVRMGGRVKSATTTDIVVDSPITIEAGETYSVSVVLPDQTVASAGLTNPIGDTETLQLDQALAQAPIENAIWVVTATNVEPRLFRVLANAEVEPNIYEITGLLHDPGKYGRIEQDLVLDPPVTSKLKSGPLVAPTDLTTVEYLFFSGSQISSGVTISWTRSDDARARFYQVDVRRPGREWERQAQTSLPSIDVRDTEAGDYSFRVQAVDGFGRTSPFLTANDVSLAALTTSPADVLNLVSVVQDGRTLLVWDVVQDLRPISYEVRKGSTFDVAQIVDEITERRFTITGDGTYWVTAKTGPARSVNPASLLIEGANVFANIVAQHDEGADGWLGTLSAELAVRGGFVRLVGLGSIFDVTDIYTVADMFNLGGIEPSGTYQIATANIVDLGITRLSQVTVDYQLRGDAPGEDVRDVADIRILPSIRGEFGAFVSAKLEIRTADDAGAWSAWRAFTPGHYAARKIDLRITLMTTSPEITVILEKFAFCVDMPDRFEQSTSISVPAGGSAITYANGFQITPNLQVTIVGALAGDDVVVTAQTATGFSIQVMNGGAGAARQINYLAQGY